MDPWMDHDEIAAEISFGMTEKWPQLFFDHPLYLKVGQFLLGIYEPLEMTDFSSFETGAFNTTLRLTFIDDSTAIIRFPMPGGIMFPEEKTRNEVSVMQFISEKTSNRIPILVPRVARWGSREDCPAKLAPFIAMDGINHKDSVAQLLEWPLSARRPNLADIGCYLINPKLDRPRQAVIFREPANIVLSLSTLTFDRIGSPELDQSDNSTPEWKICRRPLTLSMNQLVSVGCLPRSKLPSLDTTYDTASSYFEMLAELHISHLINQRNDAIDSEEDCRRKFVARFLFRKMVQDQKLREKWISHENGPFPLWCDDLRPQNMLINEAEEVTGVIDWEFTYTAPVEFTHAPPWWLLLKKPEYWPGGLDHYCQIYEKTLPAFLDAMIERENEAIQNGHLEESQRLSGPMQKSWDSGDFWIMYAARNTWAFDVIYWKKIDQRFFGPSESLEEAWKERLDLLEPEERKKIDGYVSQKLEEMRTRELVWDPDQYTLEFMETMENMERIEAKTADTTETADTEKAWLAEITERKKPIQTTETAETEKTAGTKEISEAT
ncbi:hypothetical protein N7541_000270 [Penicillium brevicompactum]|uniref:Aminoglycoside phosphotransferase domain-containing protein n=1 Tax=Penicillium brevicompactum TaxID=5074 RepID=A0A9W9RVZ0_PENBR|nr:hypothetical protein N7541_000270 [Penicillium brevicompactum]